MKQITLDAGRTKCAEMKTCVAGSFKPVYRLLIEKEVSIVFKNLTQF